MRCILNRVLLALSWISIRAAADAQMLLKKQGFSPKLAEMPLDEMRLMLEQWGNITGEPRGVDYTEVLGSWTPASNGWSDVEQGEVCYLLVDRP